MGEKNADHLWVWWSDLYLHCKDLVVWNNESSRMDYFIIFIFHTYLVIYWIIGISNLGVLVMCLEEARGPEHLRPLSETGLQTFPFSSRGNIPLDRICTQPTKKISEKPWTVSPYFFYRTIIYQQLFIPAHSWFNGLNQHLQIRGNKYIRIIFNPFWYLLKDCFLSYIFIAPDFIFFPYLSTISISSDHP